ncbi:MAG: hypothetical protein AB2740_20275 [Candidatus Thiodiazotropha sp.]
MTKRFVLLFSILFSLIPPAQAASPCTQAAAESLAKLYWWSWPITMEPDEFIRTAQANSSALTSDSNIVRCAAILGPRLVNLGINAYDPKAYERAMGAGPAELAPRVADSLNSTSFEYYRIGNEIAWLARVLPLFATGRTEPYAESTLRMQQWQMLQQYRQIEQLTGQTGYLELMRKMMDPIIREQIFMLAMMVGQ